MARTFYVGADTRIAPGSVSSWTPDRRETFLVRPGVARPLSVDPTVWGRAPHHGDERLTVPLPWVSVDDVIEQSLSRADAQERVVIALGVVAFDAQEERIIASSMGVDTELVVQADWAFLGFDVVDGDTSGLCNCGYANHELSALRPTWSRRLNDHGLFSEIDHARSFRRITNARVPEHAPFYVFGIWRVAPRST